MLRFSLLAKLVTLTVSIAIFSQVAHAQIELRRGVVQLIQMREFASEGTSTLSNGTLAELEIDPYFGGDFQLIVNTAASILDEYTIVSRGGYFPENAGIPRDRQLTTSEAVYHIFSLDNGYELILFRSPTENTSEYFIRTQDNSF